MSLSNVTANYWINTLTLAEILPLNWVIIMKSLYLIRHGQSLANTGAESMPDASIPLSPLGLEQAQALAARWHITPAQIYCSKLLRAQQTAQVFCDKYDKQAQPLAQLNEMRCLAYETVVGMTGEQRGPLAQQYWQQADLHYRDAMSADSFADFLTRVDAFITAAPDFEHHSLFFGHGIWIGLLAWRLMGCEVGDNADIRRFRQFQTAMPMYNTVVYRLDISTSGVMQLRVMPVE